MPHRQTALMPTRHAVAAMLDKTPPPSNLYQQTEAPDLGAALDAIRAVLSLGFDSFALLVTSGTEDVRVAGDSCFGKLDVRFVGFDYGVDDERPVHASVFVDGGIHGLDAIEGLTWIVRF